jgi:ABC-type amino acid transport substrate-binding protein
LENKFLLSAPYGKTEIAVATLAKNNKIWTLADLNGKTLAFIPKDVSNEQILGIWRNSKLNATQSLDDATNSLRNGEVAAIVASRHSLEAKKDSLLQIFPNKLLENNIVALFAPGSNSLQEEFNRNVMEVNVPVSVPLKVKSDKPKENTVSDKERMDKIILLLNELKKEIEILQEGMK